MAITGYYWLLMAIEYSRLLLIGMTAIDRFTPLHLRSVHTCDRCTGIWVNVGRTWAVATKPELYLPWSEGDLVGRWLSKFGLPQRRLVEDRDFELSVSICRTHAAAEALKTARGGALKTDRCEAEWLLRRRPLNASAAERRPLPSQPLPSQPLPSVSALRPLPLQPLPSQPLPSCPPLSTLPSGPCKMAGHQCSSVLISAHQWSSVLSSGPMIGVVGSSQSPQHAWNPLRYRLAPHAMCRLHDTCRCTLAAAAAASGPSALPRRARDGSQHDAAPASHPTGLPTNSRPLNTTRLKALSEDTHWLGYPEMFPFMAYELGLDSVQIGPIAGGAYRGDASVNGQGDASVNGSAARASAGSAASGRAAHAGSVGSAGRAAAAGGHGSRRALPLSSAARPLPPPGTPGWRAEIVITSAACMGAPVRRMPKLGWRTCLDGWVDVRAGYFGDDVSGSTVAGHVSGHQGVIRASSGRHQSVIRPTVAGHVAGHPSNGHPSNGHPSNGHPSNGRRENGDGKRHSLSAVAGAGRACDCDQTARLLNCDGAHWSCRPYCRPPHQSDSARRQMLCSRGDCAGCQFCAARLGKLPV